MNLWVTLKIMLKQSRRNLLKQTFICVIFSCWVTYWIIFRVASQWEPIQQCQLVFLLNVPV